LEAAASKAIPCPPIADVLDQLMRDIRGRDERALEQLYEATVGKLYALAFSIVRCMEDAEEVVCSTYAHVWTHAYSYSADRGSVLGWLLMMCRSRAIDRLRQLRSGGTRVDISAVMDVRSEEAPPDQMLVVLQEHGRVRAALAKLSPERRRFVSLAFFGGLSHQEIATATGAPLGTVKSHVRRALQQLRDELE
jgi:RNA polymerase sigma factor (sigma-70 family)